MRLNPAILGVIAALAGVAAGCGSSAGSSPTLASTTTKTTPPGTTSSTSTSGAGALQGEANAAAAGDIPDNQIFLVFRDPHAGYTMKYPEGWARQGSGDRVTFRDKNNIIRAVVSGGPVWTMSSVQADARTLKDARVRSQPRAITLSGRPAFKVVYRTVSAPNPVTGKRVTLSVDRYYLSKAHRRAVLDLGSPVGVDNVDAYRLISQSFPVELKSLYREPERPEELRFGALEFHDVFRIFRSGPAETVALRGLDLRIEQGEQVALFGPSGSGKSTALHLAAGLDESSAGDVVVFGRSLARLSEVELAAFRAREVALVFQSGNLWTDLSAQENIVVGLRLAGRDDVRDAAERALMAFDLQGRGGQRAGSLSGGEQQRVAIAAAAARQAPLVLADEPTAELDVRSELIVLEALRRLRDEFGSTVVVVTHSPRVAWAADRVLEIRDGRVAA